MQHEDGTEPTPSGLEHPVKAGIIQGFKPGTDDVAFLECHGSSSLDTASFVCGRSEPFGSVFAYQQRIDERLIGALL
jgi:hypothetical protein